VIVHTYHGQGFEVFEQRWKETVALAMERGLARLSTGNIVVSQTQLSRFVRLGIGPAGRLKVIRYGLDLEPFIAAPTLPRTLRKDLGLTDDARLIGVVARVIYIKGQDVFLRAAGRLVQENPSLHFVIAGDGEQRQEFEALARALALDGHVHFLGWRRDIPFVLANLDIVVLPTVLEFEGVPLALIEALATGRPVIASRVGGVGELVRDGETGVLVEPRDDAGLARAMATLIGDPPRMKALAEGGQRLVTGLYQRDRMIAETERFYRECLGKRTR
jgi:glycosyltransferase involved in cell wall biosynthesis